MFPLYRNLKRSATNDSLTSTSRQDLKDVTLPTPFGFGDDDEQQDHDISGYPIQVPKENPEIAPARIPDSIFESKGDVLYFII